MNLIRRERNQRHRHLDANGYVATRIAFDDSRHSPNSEEYLFVYVLVSGTMYRVAGMFEASDAARLDREMQGRIASFQVKKILVSATDLEVIEVGGNSVEDHPAMHTSAGGGSGGALAPPGRHHGAALTQKGTAQKQPALREDVVHIVVLIGTEGYDDTPGEQTRKF